MEGGTQVQSQAAEEDLKKGVAGLLPVVVQLWSFVRLRFPWILQYIGDKPPRLGLLGQIGLIYIVFIHVVLSYEISKRCKPNGR